MCFDECKFSHLLKTIFIVLFLYLPLVFKFFYVLYLEIVGTFAKK